MLTKRDMNNLDSAIMLYMINQHKSKRKAADALGTSVDTLSKYIENFEDQLGVKLLSHNSRGCLVTLNGQKVLNCSQEIIRNLYDMYDIKPETSQVSGMVRVGLMTGIHANLISFDAKDFFDAYPHLKVVSMAMPELPDLNLMSYDIGLTYVLPNFPNIECEYKKTVKCGFFASPIYLNEHGYPSDLKDLAENHRIVNKIDHGDYFIWWKDFLKQAKHVCYSSNTAYSVSKAICNGVGIGIMPMRYKAEGMVCLDNFPCEADLPFYMLTHKDTRKQPRIRAVVEYCKKLMDRI